MQAELDKGTNLALVLPESELAVEERSGIVKFVDVSTPPNTIMFRQKLVVEEDTLEAKPSSIDFTSNISVNKDSKLRILIDPVAGDSLVIQGEATFSSPLTLPESSRSQDGTRFLMGRTNFRSGILSRENLQSRKEQPHVVWIAL